MTRVETKPVVAGVEKTEKYLRQRNGKMWQPAESKG